jgi:hypothetical protein
MPDEPSDKGHDVVLLHGRTDDGDGIRVIRSRPDKLEVGELRAAKEGKPIMGGEMVTLHPRAESPLLYDVEVAHDARVPVPVPARGAGPARVSSEAYRRNWDAIFGDADVGMARDSEPADGSVLN